MSSRGEVLSVLSKIAFGHGFLDEHPMRARAFSNALRTLKKIPNLEQQFASGELAGLPGIGAGILEVIGAVLAGRPVEALSDLQARIPAGIFEARKIRGVGPRKLRALHESLGVTTLAEIEYACNENRLVSVPGFGARTQAKILEAIAALRDRGGRLRLDQGLEVASREAARLEALDGVLRVAVVGDARRGTETVGGVELLALTETPDEAGLGRALAGQWRQTRDGVRAIEYDAGGVPVRVVHCGFADLFGVLSVWLTGSAEHLEALKARAAERGMLLGPVGLFEGSARVACPDDASVYAALALMHCPPERREGHVPLVNVGRARPQLVCLQDLRGALHNHTTSSDGVNSLAEMCSAAAAANLSYLGVSEHSQTAAYAGGLDAQRLARQVADIEAFNRSGAVECVALSGVESDILRDGALDYPDDVLATLDFVVASVHNRYRQDPQEMTARMVAAARNPWTDIIGHPTGRLILGRKPADYDVEAMLDACVASGCAVELNANPQRLDLNERHLAMARERGIPVSISADAHSAAALSHLSYGITIARRAGLKPEHVLNAMPLGSLRDWLQVRKNKASRASLA